MSTKELYNSLEILSSELSELRKKRRDKTKQLDDRLEAYDKKEFDASSEINKDKINYPNAEARKAGISKQLLEDRITQMIMVDISAIKDEIVEIDADIELKQNRIQNMRLLFRSILVGLGTSESEE